MRKADHVGYRNAVVYAAELFSRKTLLWPLVNHLCDRETFDIVSRSEFHQLSDPLLSVTDETESYDALAAPFVANMGPGYILTGTGLVITDEGRILNESLFPRHRGRRFVVAKLIWQLFFESTQLTTALARKNVDTLDQRAEPSEVVAPLIPRYSDNYYHWMIETVPKIRYVRAFECQTGMDVTYLVPGDAPSWLEETLELLQIPDEKIEWASNSVYRADHLILPSFPLRTRHDYDWIIETVLGNARVDRDAIGAGNNIFISRANAIERRAVNEGEVMTMLSDYGFQKYHLEDLTVAENVTLFHEADMVVGAHGAGLTDLIYCENATVIELFGSMVKDPYKRLAKTVSVDYDSLQCKPKSTDIHIDVDDLEKLIRTHLTGVGAKP